MAWLTIEGTDVEATLATRHADDPFGDFEPAYSGVMHSDKRGTFRALRVTTDFMEIEDAEVLRTVLRSPGPILFGGDGLDGDSVHFHVTGPVEMTPLGANLVALSFAIRETNETPSQVLFSFDGEAPGAYTSTRSGTVGPYTNISGTLQSGTVVANTLRRDWTWQNGVYTLSTLPDTAAGLVEAARINLISSDDFDGGWTSVNTPVVTTTISDPAGGTGAYRIADNDAGSVEEKYLLVAFTGDAVKSLAFVVREATMPAAGNQSLRLHDVTAGADRLTLNISAWTAGVPTVAATAGTYLGKRYLGHGYWALYAQTTSVTAASTHRVYIDPAVTSAQTGAIDIYRVNAYNALVPAWSILDASETKAVDTVYAPTTFKPQTLTLYVKMIEAGAIAEGNDGTIVHIGSGTITTTARLSIFESGGFYVATYGASAGNVTDTQAAAPSWGDLVEFRLVIEASGITFGQSINAGTEAVVTEATARQFDLNWAADRLYLGGPATFGQSITPIIAVRVLKGVRTMAECRTWADARLHNRILT